MLKLKRDNIYNVTGDIDMKITKQRLKEIIVEELEGSKNEGIFDFFRKKKKEPEGPSAEEKEAALKKQQEEEAERKINKVRDFMSGHFKYGFMDKLEYFDSTGRLRRAFTGPKMDDGHYLADDVADAFDKGTYFRGVLDSDNRFAALERQLARAILKVYGDREVTKSDVGRIIDTLVDAVEDRYKYQKSGGGAGIVKSPERRGQKYRDKRPNAYMGGGQSSQRMMEGKITKSDLKTIIAEELTKAEKARKKKLEKELDDLKHK